MPTYTERLTNFLSNLLFNIFILVLFGFLFMVLLAIISLPVNSLASQIQKHTDICQGDDIDSLCLQTMGFIAFIGIIIIGVSPFATCYYIAHRLDNTDYHQVSEPDIKKNDISPYI